MKTEIKPTISAYGLTTRYWSVDEKGYRCSECCTGDRCDEDCYAPYRGRRKSCPHCKGTGNIPHTDVTPTPSHSEETETTEKKWTYSRANADWFIINKPDGSVFSYFQFEDQSKEICDKFNSYSTLKAENVELKISDELWAHDFKAIKQEKAVLIETVRKDTEQIGKLQSDNEAKEKRIEEQKVILIKCRRWLDMVCNSPSQVSFELGKSASKLFDEVLAITTPPIDTKP